MAANHPNQPHAAAICRVAVAQICLSAGYSGAQTAALRALSDIAARYIRLLATEAASAANSRGRTQSNAFDVAIALERAAAGRGYGGASDVARPPLASPVLRELRAFVAAVDEVPFAQPVGRRGVEGRKGKLSFAQVGEASPLAWVPNWLPCFPEEGRKGENFLTKDSGCRDTFGVRRVRNKVQSRLYPPYIEDISTFGVCTRKSLCKGRNLCEVVEKEREMVLKGKDMMRERERVRFRLGYGGEKGGRKRMKNIEIGGFLL